MLNTAEKFETTFDAYDLVDSNFRDELVDVPKVVDWDYAREMTSVLQLFERKTTRASASSHVHVNLFCCYWWWLISSILMLLTLRII